MDTVKSTAPFDSVAMRKVLHAAAGLVSVLECSCSSLHQGFMSAGDIEQFTLNHGHYLSAWAEKLNTLNAALMQPGVPSGEPLVGAMNAVARGFNGIGDVVGVVGQRSWRASVQSPILLGHFRDALKAARAIEAQFRELCPAVAKRLRITSEKDGRKFVVYLDGNPVSLQEKLVEALERWRDGHNSNSDTGAMARGMKKLGITPPKSLRKVSSTGKVCEYACPQALVGQIEGHR